MDNSYSQSCFGMDGEGTAGSRSSKSMDDSQACFGMDGFFFIIAGFKSSNSMDDSMVYFGTGKGVVAYSKLDNSDDICDQPVIVTSDLPPVHLIVLSRKGDYLMVAAKNIVAVFDARQGEQISLYKVK